MSAVADRSGAGAGRSALAPRLGLGLVAAGQAEVGFWGLIDPHSFFANFPGAGHHWVSALGAYNQHLVRDYAAAELGLAVLLALAALRFQRGLVLGAGVAFLVATVPHLVYHLTTTNRFSTADNLASLGAFVLELVLVALATLSVAQTPALLERRP
ncbi:MAG: hypothetical protein M3Z06_09245 [Actinomycetota bacterium]|nr:hypothetical protein [Actinomycetota bacterium]